MPQAEQPGDPVRVCITAPSTLAGGYKFDAVFDGEVFSVTVPPSGVLSGQSFVVPFVPTMPAPVADNESTPMLKATTSSNQGPRIGSFQTGLCDCCAEGITHPSFLNAWCCPQILMGQVLTRMKLNFCACSGGGDAYKNTTEIWILATVVYWCSRFYEWRECVPGLEYYQCLKKYQRVCETSMEYYRCLEYYQREYGAPLHTTQISSICAEECLVNYEREKCDPLENPQNSSKCAESIMSFGLLKLILIVTTVFVLARLRQKVRKARGIRQSLGFLEDLCCAICCGCCTVSMLARETADYRKYRAYYFTNTGINDEYESEAFEQGHEGVQHPVSAHPADDQPLIHDHNNKNNYEAAGTVARAHIV